MIVKNTLLSQNLLIFPGCAILWSPLLYSWENNHAEIKYIIYFTTHSIVFSTQNLNLNRLKNEYYIILQYIWNYEKLLTSLKITTVPLPPTYVLCCIIISTILSRATSSLCDCVAAVQCSVSFSITEPRGTLFCFCINS
jgi:hypothetical protein